MRHATGALLALVGIGLAAPAAAEEREPPSGPEGLGVAFRALQEGDYERAFGVATELHAGALENGDYAHYAAAQAAYVTGRHAAALVGFQALARDDRSRFQDIARWRIADALWQLGHHEDARARYQRLLRRLPSHGDGGTAQYRIGEAHRLAGDRERAIAALREVRVEYPQHPLEPRATARLYELGGAEAARLSPAQRIRRAEVLGDDLRWEQAHREAWSIGTIGDDELDADRRYWTAMTLYRQRRQYRRAGDILLAHYAEMGRRAARAMFHGARALSRADDDEEAIEWYLRVVEQYPRSRWAPEAQFLAGWLWYNMGRYGDAIPLLAKARKRYRRSSSGRRASWYLGFSHFLVGSYDEAVDIFEEMSRRRGAMWAGKGLYWKARSLAKLGQDAEAEAAYRELVGRYPFTWYALLAGSRLRARDAAIGPFGDDPPSPDEVPALAESPPAALARDRLIRRAKELVAAGLRAEASVELERGERYFLRRHRRRRPGALRVLLELYRRAGNYTRPWTLAATYGGSEALSAPPKGRARTWWEHAYPLAFDEIVEPWRKKRALPRYYVHAIMRKESGFDPSALSYANARGLVQMIPRTTRRIAAILEIDVSDDMLWDPTTNLRLGTWYLGGLYEKFRGQIPLAAGSFNSGPVPVMEWIDQHGERPIDELVELASYSQTREYMKLVTATYARYLYLYDGEVYEQPLEVDADYRDDDLVF